MATLWRVIAKPIFVVHTILFQQGFKFLLNEVVSIVTNKDARDAAIGEDELFERPSDHSGVISGASKDFHPFRRIIHNDQDMFIASRGLERSHEIHTPNIEVLDLKNVVQEHFIPAWPILVL